MSYGNSRGGMSEYKKVDTQSGVAFADPHRLIQMLMEGALDKIAIAKGCLERNDIAGKGSHISWAISIIDGLRMSLDKTAGSDIAQNLDDLYDYMGRRLLQANIKSDPAMLDEVASLIREIKSAWDAIPDDIRKAHAEAKRREQQDIVEAP